MLAIATALSASAQPTFVEVPRLTARVVDQSALLSVSDRDRLERMLAAFEAETQHQVVVLTLSSTAPETIEQFGIRLAEAWRVGTAEYDNGVIMIVASEDRRARIEVGYGLEGVLPDATANRILEDVMIPKFRAGRMDVGILRGAEAILAVVSGEALPDRPRRRRDAAASPLVHGTIMAGLFGTIVGTAVGGRKRWQTPATAGVVGAGGGFVITGLAIGAAAGAFAAAFFSGLLLMGDDLGGGRVRRGGVFHPGSIGHGSGGFGRGGGFGGGGFGGGLGGGFGGGGASGGW